MLNLVDLTASAMLKIGAMWTLELNVFISDNFVMFYKQLPKQKLMLFFCFLLVLFIIIINVILMLWSKFVYLTNNLVDVVNYCQRYKNLYWEKKIQILWGYF